MTLDVIVQTTHPDLTYGLSNAPSLPGLPVQLTEDIRIEELEDDLYRSILKACEARGRFEHEPHPQYGQRYAFVRDAGNSTEWKWDEDNKLLSAIALSRLIYPTPIATHYSARILDLGKSEETIIPGAVADHGAFAYVGPAPYRDWLTNTELEQLKALLGGQAINSLPSRVRKALWLHEYAATTKWIDARWPLVGTALEALVHTRDSGPTRDFRERVPQLADRLGAIYSEAAARRFYQLRSSIVHGEGLGSLLDDQLDTYMQTELVLRAALRQSIAEPSFSKIFENNKAISKAFAVPSPVIKQAGISAIRGTRDLLPPETALWNFVEAAVRDVFRVYNFHEIRTPIIEDLQLFQRSVGEETDIVSKEMFAWEDRSRAESEKGQMLALRPENTAGVVRAYIEHKLWERPGLQKLFYIGPQFRRERPQKGRYRQFYQIGAEVIGPPASGSESAVVDAEVLELLATLLDRVGISGWTLELNSVGCEHDRPRYNEALKKALAGVIDTMCADCQRRYQTNPLRVLDCKVPADQPIIEKLPKMLDYLDDDCRAHFEKLQELLRAVAVPFEINKRMVRGLDYYRKTAFEFTHGALGAQNAILGGGRYDGLSESLGGPPAPGIGFAIGEDRFVMALQQETQAVTKPLEVYVAPMGAGMDREAAKLARELRRHDVSVELGNETFRLKKSLETASKIGARYVVIVGENEVKSGAFALKNLATGEQVSVLRAELPERIRQ